MRALERRKELLLQHFGLSEKVVRLLETYLEAIWKANEDLNLVSRKMTEEELVDNHLIDCLLPLSRFPSQAKEIADFGSGSGLPSVVFAIIFPDKVFHLYEKSQKKCEFLKACQGFAPNIRIHGEIPAHLKGIDLVIARAFKPLAMILQLSSDHLQKGGSYFLLKARKEKILEEIADAKKIFPQLKATIEPLSSPVLKVERHLLLVNGPESALKDKRPHS